MVLTINGGSSSIKFALFDRGEMPNSIIVGQIEKIGQLGTCLKVSGTIHIKHRLLPKENDYPNAIVFLVDFINDNIDLININVIVHRIVHGMQLNKPSWVDEKLLDQLRKLIAFDPDHLPLEIKLIESFSKVFPKIRQLVCFDTHFHRHMPRIAKLLPIPRRFDEIGVQKYGFHGLSYNHLLLEVKRLVGKKAAKGKLIFAHLGSGASLAAVKNGVCIDTSMGFTPCGGVLMGTRSGDLDPGVSWFLMEHEKLSPKQFNYLVNHESGLFGVSAQSSDMNELLANQSKDLRCREAVNLFCYAIKKQIGSFCSILGGLDMLVFSGGIGENSSDIRSMICEGLEFLGIEINRVENNRNALVISCIKKTVTILVIPANEELMMARTAEEMLQGEI